MLSRNGRAGEVTVVDAFEVGRRGFVGERGCQFWRLTQVFIEAVGKTILGARQLIAGAVQAFGIDFSQCEKSFAGGNLCGIDAENSARNLLWYLCLTVYGVTIRPGPLDRMRSMPAMTVRLASSIRVRAVRAPLRSPLR